MEPEDVKPESEQVPTPAPKKGWVGTGLGCLVLVIGCGFALLAAFATGMKHSNNQGAADAQSVMVGALIVALIIGACWIAFRHRGPK